MAQKYTIDENRLYKLFKRILDSKFSELTLDEYPDWKTKKDEVDWVDSNGKPVIYYHDETFHVLREFFYTFLRYMPLSYQQTDELFTRYFEEKFPNKPFISVTMFDL